MRKIILLILTTVLLLGLTGCGTQHIPSTQIKISLVETDGCTVENNGQIVQPGEDVVFLVAMEPGVSLASTDYAGPYNAVLKDGKLELTLENVQYPSRVKLNLTSRYSTITYMPNGGMGKEIVKTHDRTNHRRPNTEIGTNVFSRDGHTLIGWNTQPDGSGERVGLGSRVSAGIKMTLYAQWMPWNEESEFAYSITEQDSITINGYLGSAETVVIPERIDGFEVTAVAAGAFENSTVKHIVFPITMDRVEAESFLNSDLESVILFDNIQEISDGCFEGCDNLKTLYINAIEAPWGYDYRKESVYADKVDLLIESQGEKKLVFYAGCSVWYNLDGAAVERAFGEDYAVINMGLNGFVNSVAQMQILGEYLENGDMFLHTLELTSRPQLMIVTEMSEHDDKLWCGIEYNYDLFTLVDLRTVDGAFDSLTSYLQKKKTQTTYSQYYVDDDNQVYMDEYGCIPFYRGQTNETLADRVHLDPSYIEPAGMERLEEYYDWYQDKGVAVYVSYACVNMDAVPEEEKGNVSLMDNLVKEAIHAMDGPVVISDLADFLYAHEDFYDTNYHLLTKNVKENTAIWICDLREQMVIDGLWEDTE